MRIAYISDETFPNNEASGLQIMHTCSALVEEGAEVDLFYPVTPASRRRPEEDVRAELKAHFHAICGFGLKRMPTVFHPWRPGIKVAQTLAATAVSLSGDYDFTYTRNIGPILPTMLAGRPLLFETYRPLTRQFPKTRRVFQKAAARSNFMGIITHSQFTTDAFLADGLPADRVQTVYNGFDPTDFQNARRTAPEARRLLGLPERPTVVYAGRIAPVKGTDLLFQAAALTPDVQWVLAGDVRTADAKPYVARAAGMSNISLPGYLTGDALITLLQAADVLIVPPSQQVLEQHGTTVLPIKIFNYLAAGRAIVAGDLPDARELLIDGVNARLVTPDDPLALADAVHALAHDHALRGRFVKAALARAEGLTWRARARKILDFSEGRLSAMGR